MTSPSFAVQHLLELKQNLEPEATHVVEVFHELHASDHPQLAPLHDYLQKTELPVHDTKDLLHSLSLAQAIPILVRNEAHFNIPGTGSLANTSKLQHVFMEHFYTSSFLDQLLRMIK